MLDIIVKILEKLQPYIPLLQSLVWPIFIVFMLLVFRKQTSAIVKAIQQRIERGSSVKAGPFEIGKDLEQLDYAEPTQKNASINKDSITQDWDQERNSIYEKNRGLFLAHVITPARDPKQKYDIYIYIIKHKTTDLSSIEYAEFFFGHMWGSEIFKEYPKRGVIGISTSAYGPFLCTCKVHMKDKTVVFLSRYIDFEMGRMINAQQRH